MKEKSPLVVPGVMQNFHYNEVKITILHLFTNQKSLSAANVMKNLTECGLKFHIVSVHELEKFEYIQCGRKFSLKGYLSKYLKKCCNYSHQGSHLEFQSKTNAENFKLIS